METVGDINLLKICPKFYCKFCDYATSKKSSFKDHLLSAKHLKSINCDSLETNCDIILPKICSSKLTCERCNKNYTSRNGLWKHKQKCNEQHKIINQVQNNNEPTDKELIMLLIKENSELKNMMMKVIENGTHNTTTNSHNKTFNLQLFLNETCKDAMNIMDFVDSIKLQLSDLENVGKLGYVEGISNIIVKNLNDLDVTERPIHCTDKKRETLYIKDEDKWEKEDEEKKKIKKVIKHVANKNVRLIKKYKEVHPDCNKSSSKFSDQYDKIIVEAMGGSGDNDTEKEEKIIQRISKNVTIDKECTLQTI